MEQLRNNHFGSLDKAIGIFETNFHSNLPAVKRMRHMADVFRRLARKQHFGGGDFMHECQAVFQVAGVLDGGTFRAMSNEASITMVKGSYLNDIKLNEIGYLPTRSDHILSRGFEIRVTQM